MVKISTSPHMIAAHTTQSLMTDVIIALIPAIIAAVMFFGLPALLVIVTSVTGCILCEYVIARYLMKVTPEIRNGSATVTGILLAFNLPSSIPLWMVLIGCFVAIGIAKMAFGGLGKNLFNPALVGRVFLFISFPVQMTLWPKPSFLNFLQTDSQTAATTLGILKHADASSSATALTRNTGLSEMPDYFDMFVGNIGGSLGEVSALAILLGLIYLLYRRVISWHIPFYYLATVFIFTGILWLTTGTPQTDPVTNLLSGGLMLGAVFMATDYVTSPMSAKGKVVFGIGCGILTVIIRLYSLYPEGVSFAILIMNAFVPLIDNLTRPRVFGKGKR